MYRRAPRFLARASTLAAALALVFLPACRTADRDGASAQPRPQQRSGNLDMVRIDKELPREVNAGKSIEYRVRVTNTSDLMLHNVRVSEFMSTENAMGDPAEGEIYRIGSLRPGQSRSFTARMRVDEVGPFELCSAVLYTPVVCTSLQAVQPQLVLDKQGPRFADVGEQFQYELIVSNPGVGTAREVVVEDMLPEELVPRDGRRSHRFEVGTLAAGESRRLSVPAQARAAGQFTNRARAMAAGDLRDEAQATTIVRRAQLEIEKTGPQANYTNISTTFNITVRNTGTAPARNVVVTDEIPGGTSFVSATGGGQLQGSTVRWNLGTIEPDQSRTVSLNIEGERPGTLRNCATADADNAEQATDCATVRLEGVTGLLIEVVDENDPIRVGDEEIYTISITNQGSQNANNVMVRVLPDPRTSIVSATGQTSSRRVETGLVFLPLATLEPQGTATWQVRVRGEQPGDTRLRVQMTADELALPVTEEEATRIFD